MVPGKTSYGNSDADAYAAKWSSQTQGLLVGLASNNVDVAVNATSYKLIHSWACYNHDVSESSAFYTLTSMGTSQYNAVKILQEGDTQAQRQLSENTLAWIEECKGLFCGSGCN